MSLLVIIYAISGGVALFIVAPVCLVLFSKIIIWLLLGRGLGQLKRTMRLIGALCLPAFVAGGVNLIIKLSFFLDGGLRRVMKSYADESVLFWFPFYGAALSFVLYALEKLVRGKGGELGDRYYIAWFLLFLVACYAPMISWFLLPARQ